MSAWRRRLTVPKAALLEMQKASAISFVGPMVDKLEWRSERGP
jgi:hypothetical protein